MRFHLAVLLMGWSVCLASSAATPPAPQRELVLDILGHIYPLDQFPARCADLLKGAKCTEPSFGSFHIQTHKEGEIQSSSTTFMGPEGIQVTETSIEKAGHVKKAVVENRALQKRCELEVREGKVHYTVTDLQDQSVKTATDDAEENLVVSSTVISYVTPHFEELQAGKELRLKVAVLDRRESFSFVIKKIRNEVAVDGSQIMVLEMVPTSFIVKALVDPMYFYVKPKSSELFAFEGRSALRRKQGNQYKEMNVRTAYEYKVNRVSTTSVTKNCDPGIFLPGQAQKCEVKAQ
jgi:hypothetical protein